LEREDEEFELEMKEEKTPYILFYKKNDKKWSHLLILDSNIFWDDLRKAVIVIGSVYNLKYVWGRQEGELSYSIADRTGSIRSRVQSEAQDDRAVRSNQIHQKEREGGKRYQGHARLNRNPQKA
jgi:hypothetical protein